MVVVHRGGKGGGGRGGGSEIKSGQSQHSKLTQS